MVVLYALFILSHKIVFMQNMQHCVHIHSGTCWCILSIQSRGSVHCTCCHICSNFRDCWIYCNLILLPTRRNKLGMRLWVFFLQFGPWTIELAFVLIFNHWSLCTWPRIWQVRNLLLTGCLFCGPLFLTFFFLNTVAIFYHATAALPFGTIVVIVLIWTLVTSPLLVLGGIAGKNNAAEFQAPCRTTKYPREIPPLPWYRGAIPQMAMAGFLPFSAIYIELYYIFASVWGHRIYTIYSILFIVFIILLIVTAFITVALTYFQLAAEDHEWWWRYEVT